MKRVAHKIVHWSSIFEGWYVACGRIAGMYRSAHRWRDVTCKDCLRRKR